MNAKAQHICDEHSPGGICTKATCPLAEACRMHYDENKRPENKEAFFARMDAAAAEVVVEGWD